ncbi:NADPH-dependent FMN reductase [Blastomonas natatoria]|uniref:NADPH-dependent FMN reductase n=1 Tax=Blastomonas natatoria TaxID=34015 RepID=A0A2V3VCH2_9SPHN|nr:flavodoxin domain-containing protein [Blastomonas natatoria]PXW79417.1 NADPH-dependent FMN reductase [Blastomonas natatoria]
MSQPPTLLIVWHSRTGTARAMAQAAADAARAEGEVRMLAADEAHPEDLLAASGYLFVCPENLASMTGAMKEFFDQSYYPLLGRIEGRPYAAMVAAGSDGAGAVRQIERISTGWRLKRIAESLIVCTHAQTPEQIAAPKLPDEAALARCGELGAMIGAGLAMGIF